jgi:hypothetical protein
MSTYWKFQLGGVTPAKYKTMLTTLESKPNDTEIFTVNYNGSTAATIGFGGDNVDATKTFIQNSIITPLGLLTSSNQAIASGELCKTAKDSGAKVVSAKEI